MIYLAIFFIFILCVVIIALLISYHKEKKNYKIKINLLEKIIVDLKENLENKNLKVKISDETILKIRESNKILSQDILDLNTDLFEKLYTRK